MHLLAMSKTGGPVSHTQSEEMHRCTTSDEPARIDMQVVISRPPLPGGLLLAPCLRCCLVSRP